MFPEAASDRALVTGAAGGIGRAVALQLAGAGARIALLDRDAVGLVETAKLCAEAGAGQTLELCADVSVRADVESAVSTAADVFGGLDRVVSAAGVLTPGGLADVTDEDWARHFAVNTTGVLHLLQAASPHLDEGSAVVVISSNAARVPRTGMIAYAASKAATSALTRCAGLELAARGIRCNVVEPGSTATPMQRDLWPDPIAGEAAAAGGDPAAYRLGIPLGRVADPDDVAAVVCFLLSPAARHITLQQVFVDGGASL